MAVAVIEYSEPDKALIAKNECGAIVAVTQPRVDGEGQINWPAGITALMGDHSIENYAQDGDRYIVEYV